MVKESPQVVVELTADEIEHVINMMADELKVGGKIIEVAEKMIEDLLKNPLISDIEELIARGWVWFTVIPEKEKEEKEGEKK